MAFYYAINQPSNLLNSEENINIFSLLGSRCSSLLTTVVELYKAVGNDQASEWIWADVGVLCLVRDPNVRSFFFKLYCPNRRSLIWEHELYNYMEYIKLNANLHCFEAETCVIGFNFANEDEAEILYELVHTKIRKKKTLQSEKSFKRNYTNVECNNTFISNNPQTKNTLINKPQTENTLKIKFNKGKKTIKGKLKKDMIGKPTNFRHLTHFSYGYSDKNFNLIDEDQLNRFFDKAGLSKEQRNDPGTQEFVHNFIRENGGMEAVKSDLMETALTPEELPPPTSTPPPPPPPPRSRLPSHTSPAPPPLPLSSPPPLPIFSPPPLPSSLPPPISPDGSQTDVDSHGALLQSIRQGKTLKHVATPNHDGRDELNPGATVNRSNFLDEIKHGVQLHSIPKVEENKAIRQPKGGLAEALSRALASRQEAIQQSDSEDSSEEVWDDSD